MSPKVDTSDLIDAHEVAELLGLSKSGAVSVYRSRYEDFPEPVIAKGTCHLWHRPEVEAWKRGHPRRG